MNDLLQHEFTDAPPNSYNGLIGDLVKQIRYYREVPFDEFKAAMPKLKVLEKNLNNLDDVMNQPRREYITEILEALKQETESEENLIEDLTSSAKVIISTLYEKNFDLADYAYELRSIRSIRWIEFYGYREGEEADERLKVVTDIFRSLCARYGFIFIDSTTF